MSYCACQKVDAAGFCRCCGLHFSVHVRAPETYEVGAELEKIKDELCECESCNKKTAYILELEAKLVMLEKEASKTAVGDL